MVSPAGASTSRPSRMNLMGPLVSLMASPAVFATSFQGASRAPVFKHAQQRIGRRLSEAADRDSCIAVESSVSSASFHGPDAISIAAFSVLIYHQLRPSER